MAENKSAFEFLSKCWAPFIISEQKIYYASGNTRMRDFLRDFKVSREMDMLVLGLGDVRHVMATVAGLSQRPPSSAGEVKEIRFHLNDFDKDVIARDVILLEIINKVDPESKSDAEFLWSVWYNAFMAEKDFKRLNAVLGDLIDKYSNSSRDSERICKFGDKESLRSVLKTWNSWLKRKLNQSAVKRSRLKSLEDAGHNMSFNDSNIAQYASMQIYIDRGIKESDVETVGKEMLTADRDGFVKFSSGKKNQKDFANPTMMRPGCEEWCVDDGAHAAACYLPLESKFLEKSSTIHEACLEKLREVVTYYLKSWKTTTVTYTFWATDLFHLCHWLLPFNMTFDFIFTSNLMDHVGLLNLLVTTQPRLKNSQSVLLTESFNWNVNYETPKEFLENQLPCTSLLLPSMLGLRLAEDMDLGSLELQSFYKTMYGRHSDHESIYWTKSLNQENIMIERGDATRKFYISLVTSTFWNESTCHAESNVRQTPLTTMYCFQRLQNMIDGGRTVFLQHVDLIMDSPRREFSRNRITWDVVCWAFGIKYTGDRLFIVKIPFHDIISSARVLCAQKCLQIICRLRLDCSTSSPEQAKRGEILSLFQYDALGKYFEVPILESAWKALPEDATVSVFDTEEEVSMLHDLRNRKVQVKREGEVVAKYCQPTQIHTASAHISSLKAQPLLCSEDAEKYELPKVSATDKTKEILHCMCKQFVSADKMMGVERRITPEVPYAFSCIVDAYEVKHVDNCIQAIVYKQKSCNVGKTALPFRLIDDSELLPFTCGQDIKTYLEETMICDLMFCSPNDIESRAKALSGPVLLADDAFLVLRLIIEQLWYLGSNKDKTLQHMVQLEIQKQREPSKVMILDVEGYYMYNGLPLVRVKFTETDNNSAALDAKKEMTTINVKDRRSFELIKKMLHTNSFKMSQDIPASDKMAMRSPESLNTFLQMVFPRKNGDDMILALYEYPSNSSLVKNYIEKMYSATIRKDFVAPKKARKIFKKQQMGYFMSLAAKAAPLQAGEQMSISTNPAPINSSALKQQASCSECKKSVADLKKCSRCKSVTYCSKECQMKDWPRHKKNCSSAMQITDDGPAMKESDRTASSKKPKNINVSSVMPVIQDCNPADSKVKDDALKNEEKDEDSSSAESKIENGSRKKEKNEDGSAAESKTNSGSCKKENDAALPSSAARDNKSTSSAKLEDYDSCSGKQEPCSQCNKLSSDFKKCKGCKSVAYCSKDCQAKDWLRHKETCLSVNSKNEISASMKLSSEVSSMTRPNSEDNSEVPVVKPTEDDYITKSKNEESGSYREPKNWDHSSKLEICDSGSYMKSVSEDGSTKDNSTMQPVYHATHTSKEKNETSHCSALIVEHLSDEPLQEIQNDIEKHAISDDAAVELCMCCRLEKTNLKKCTNCKSAAYCSRECQRSDWKRHRLECQTQQLPSAPSLMNRCNGCGVLGKEMKKCSQCKSACYCSAECQRRDWKNHKTTCPIIP